MKKRTLRRSIIAFSTGILILLTIAAIFSSYATAELSRSVEMLFQDHLTTQSIGEELILADRELTGYLSTKDSEILNGFLRTAASLREVSKRLEAKADFSEAGLLNRGVAALLTGFLTAADEAVGAKRGRDVARYTFFYENAKDFLRRIQILQERQQAVHLKANLKSFTQYSLQLPGAIYTNMAMLLSAFVLGFILLVQFSYRITDPLHDLARAAQAIGEGDYNTAYNFSEPTDEIRTTAQAFRTMRENVQRSFLELGKKAELEKRLIEEEFKGAVTRHQLKEAELLALQTQINPHFLYNTLSAGLQLAWSENADHTADFLENLGAFLKYVLRNPSRLVAIKEEAECVRRYVNLMKLRFSERYIFIIDIGVDTLEAMIPALILQPLIENAINHGLNERESGGVIRVFTQHNTENSNVTLIVEDNGKGLTQEERARLLEDSLEKDEEPSIGLRNVIRRIRIVTAGTGSVGLDASPEGGLAVKITLPLIRSRN